MRALVRTYLDGRRILLLSALGENGRHAYLFHQLPFDMLYPFLFGVTYCLIAMLTSYPSTPTVLIQAASVCTVAKSSFSSLYFIALSILVIVVGVRKFSVKRTRNNS